jgi:uncharacterized protein (UPF0276 family)
MRTSPPPSSSNLFPNLGHGLGLRREHYRQVVGERPRGVDWFEVISENFMVPGGNPRRVLEAVRRDYPVVLHGVSLSIGSPDPLDAEYLGRLDALARAVEPAWISDHLCFGSAHGIFAHDLLPLPCTAAMLDRVVARVEVVQERLARRILLENPSSYLQWKDSDLTEWEFLAEVARRADCGILLDVNNVFVSAHNHGFDARAYIDAMPGERVGQIHLAGHSIEGALRIDTHDDHVCAEVWELYGYTVSKLGLRAAMIEWDDAVPTFEVLRDELGRVQAVEAEAASRARGTTPDAHALRARGLPVSDSGGPGIGKAERRAV